MKKAINISVGIYGIEDHFNGNISKMVDVIRIADDLGYDRMAMNDHVIMGNRTDRYPYGAFSSSPDKPWYEPMVTMAVIAGATSRIRLSTSVLISPLRHPVLLAKMAATLDQLSNGRLELGVGVGWQKEEYSALGIPFEERWRRLDDQLRACKVLWERCPSSFSSETVSFEEIYCRPGPYQKSIPIWFGVTPTEANCRRIAEFGTGWIPITADQEKVKEGISSLRSAFIDAGRNPDELEVQGGIQFGENGVPTDDTYRQLENVMEMGITDIQIFPAFMASSSDGFRQVLENAISIKNIL